MNYDHFKHHRRSIRLKGYDYSQRGMYFVTICTENSWCGLGRVHNCTVHLSPAGGMVAREWLNLSTRFQRIQLGPFIVMPNHLHGIVIIQESTKQENKTAIQLGDIVGAFKSTTTNRYIEGVRQYEWQLFHKRFWHRNYYEHIIRNETSFHAIRQYIEDNPANWSQDKFNS